MSLLLALALASLHLVLGERFRAIKQLVWSQL
jgi:hypothetical protein